jgi:hypothetical protein
MTILWIAQIVFFFFCMGDRLNSNIQAVDGKNCVIAEKNGWLTMINFG